MSRLFRTRAKLMALGLMSASLVGCGGSGFGTGSSSGSAGSGNSGSVTTGGTTYTVTLVSTSNQLLSSASSAAQGLTLTALVRNASNNNAVSGATVTFTAQRDSASTCGSGGAIAPVNSGLTDASGSATAVLTTGGDQTNQLIDVTATVNVSGATSTPAALTIAEVGTKLAITGDSSVGLGTTSPFTVTLQDASGTPISNKVVTVSSSLMNSLSATTTTTDGNGQVVYNYTATTAGTDNLTAQATGCANYATSSTKTIQIAGQRLSIVAPAQNTQIPFSTAADVSLSAMPSTPGSGYVVGDTLQVQGGTATTPAQLKVTQIDGSGGIVAVSVINAGVYSVLPTTPAMVTGSSTGTGAQMSVAQNITARLVGGTVNGKTITFTSTRGTVSPTSALTSGAGQATVALYQTSAAGAAGGAVVTATCSDCSPTISSSANIQFNATTPASIDLQATPSTLATNATSIISAVVRDANNNPVANQTVQFTLTTDNSGGTLLQSQGTTDSSGQVSINYQAGGTTSSKNGVKVTGTVGAVSNFTTLTVGGQALRIILGTGNTLSAPNDTIYQLPYSVLVTDSAGNPISSGTVDLKISSVAYQKGFETFVSSYWTPTYEVDCTTDPGCSSTASFGCFNEDINGDGSLDAGDNDYNMNGILEPGAVASVPSSVTLDSNGTAQFQITYPKDHAYWVQVLLTATITAAGNQGSTTAQFVLPGLASDFNKQNSAPPGLYSPYGYAPGGATTDVCSTPPPN